MARRGAQPRRRARATCTVTAAESTHLRDLDMATSWEVMPRTTQLYKEQVTQEQSDPGQAQHPVLWLSSLAHCQCQTSDRRRRMHVSDCHCVEAGPFVEGPNDGRTAGRPRWIQTFNHKNRLRKSTGYDNYSVITYHAVHSAAAARTAQHDSEGETDQQELW